MSLGARPERAEILTTGSSVLMSLDLDSHSLLHIRVLLKMAFTLHAETEPCRSRIRKDLVPLTLFTKDAEESLQMTAAAFLRGTTYRRKRGVSRVFFR